MSSSIDKWHLMNEHKQPTSIDRDVINKFSVDIKVEDEVVGRVVKKFIQRSKRGIKKYGTTLEESNEDVLAFINHAQEEAMDEILYLEKLKNFYK